MTYPESSNVSAGDATFASHYNNLRSDALLLGKDSADAVALGTALERYESRLEIERLDTTKLRVPASASAPVSLLIDGYLCQAVANVDLGAGDVPAGAAAAYYIFANRADDSTTFTLTVNTVSTEAADQRRIGRFYWDGSKIVKDSVRSEFAGLIADLLYFVDPQICSGRLTLSTGVPVPTSDISSSATVYFSPYSGNRVALYVQDYGWRLYPFSELTLDISGIASGKNIDVWLYDNAGTLTLAYTEWSNDTLRATAITLQDGVYVKSGALSYRYLGTVRTSGAGVSCDTILARFVWNYYNRTSRGLSAGDTTTHTYATGTWRSWNNDPTVRFEFIVGVAEDLIPVIFNVNFKATGAAQDGMAGFYMDNTTSSNKSLRLLNIPDTLQLYGNSIAYHYGLSAIFGYHFIQITEYGYAASLSLVAANLYGDLKC